MADRLSLPPVGVERFRSFTLRTLPVMALRVQSFFGPVDRPPLRAWAVGLAPEKDSDAVEYYRIGQLHRDVVPRT